ncbi:bi-domain-containing oxidoreductase [Christiangramia sabulilitoris]|uniref:Zinc-binding dehydrogenase n=1 Tax=Christiangramia sabulilitoris TaxID=2583991 RepID=A0A550HZV9_9FLAO|nr:bi-domain-containing oxidoreductase [Christiangramia sabulilitoris]TRO64267.1 zinc-binding dehydrogenase [Christiangramia sabulilitoris]
MKQIIQDLKQGNTILEEVPAPQVKAGQVLIKTSRTLVSLGTERMLVEFGKANFIAKARQQPDKVKQVLDKMKTDGVMPTLEAVFNKLNQPLPLGYCNVGTVVAVGKGVSEFQVGDRVASNGNHAEFVSVPKNLVAKIPENVSDEEAAFTVIGAIGLQGIRLVNPTFGETIAVIGLGLIGLVTAELLKANGCKVIGLDFDQQKVDLAKEKGIKAVNPGQGTDPVKYVLENTFGIGADGIVITASSQSNEIIHQAAEMSRKKGRIVLVGVIGLDIQRADFFEKELSFQVSCSYGPGRYDDDYEQKGIDYPIGYVRWTEKRNFEAILQAIASGQLDVKPLITERVKLENYEEIYGDMRKQGSIASILEFPENSKQNSKVKVSERKFKASEGVFGIIGAGNFTSSTIIPGMKAADANLKYIASAGGLSAKTLAKKGEVAYASSDYKEILEDKDVDMVMITTRHNLHASMAKEALLAGKHVFVEKPLCLNAEELEEIAKISEEKNKMVIVGFNRRFSPLAVKMKSLLGEGPKNIIATMNAGFIPSDVWIHDLEVGGGRIIGEACHYIDLCTYLAGSKVVSVCMNALGTAPEENTDNASILLKYENGTNAVINYFANGSKSYSKERIEAFSQERTFILDNWRSLKGYGVKGFSKMKTKQDKGHKVQFGQLVNSLKKGGKSIVPFEETYNTTLASFAAIESLKQGRWIGVDEIKVSKKVKGQETVLV